MPLKAQRLDRDRYLALAETLESFLARLRAGVVEEFLQLRVRSNFCIDVSVQPYKDNGTAAGAVPVGPNIRASKFTWDSQQPGLLVNADASTTDLHRLGGLGQMTCASHNDPCRLSFIGDYFGLAISSGNIYTLSVSTHYPSGVGADDGSTLYYQQQVLGTISRTSLGI